jgi:hypothetical protein
MNNSKKIKLADCLIYVQFGEISPRTFTNKETGVVNSWEQQEGFLFVGDAKFPTPFFHGLKDGEAPFDVTKKYGVHRSSFSSEKGRLTFSFNMAFVETDG